MVSVVLLEQEIIILLIQPIVEKVRLTKGTTAMSLIFTSQTLYVSKVNRCIICLKI